MNENVSSVYEAVADTDGAAIALIQGARRVSWHELDERAARLAAYFHRAGLQPGARIVIALYNSIEYVETLLAACKARMVPVNINYRASPRELRHYFERSNAAAIVFHQSLGGTVAEAADALEPPRVLISVADQSGARLPGSADYAEIIADTAPAKRTARSGDDQLIMFTGGTTGLPKAVLWRHRDILALLSRNAGGATDFDQFAAAARAARKAGTQPHTFMLPPLMHSTGLFGTMGALAGGGTVVFSESRSLDPDRVWREIKRQRVESMTIVGDVFSRPLTDALRRLPSADARDATSSLKTIRSVGVRWSPDAKADLLEFGDMVLMDVLASSEGGAVASWETKKIDGKVATNYTLMPHAFIMGEEDGSRIALGSGKTGIVVSAGVLPDGYIGERADGTTGTFRIIDGKRVVVTGDFARAELDGTLTLIGRGSSVINTGGEKVFADEVEQVIAQHPGVADVIVAGVPDPRWGHLVGAVVALRPGVQVSETDLADLVGSELAGYKKPRQFRFVAAIERKATGKADRQWAAALLAEAKSP